MLYASGHDENPIKENSGGGGAKPGRPDEKNKLNEKKDYVREKYSSGTILCSFSGLKLCRICGTCSQKKMVMGHVYNSFGSSVMTPGHSDLVT